MLARWPADSLVDHIPRADHSVYQGQRENKTLIRTAIAGKRLPETVQEQHALQQYTNAERSHSRQVCTGDQIPSCQTIAKLTG